MTTDMPFERRAGHLTRCDEPIEFTEKVLLQVIPGQFDFFEVTVRIEQLHRFDPKNRAVHPAKGTIIITTDDKAEVGIEQEFHGKVSNGAYCRTFKFDIAGREAPIRLGFRKVTAEPENENLRFTAIFESYEFTKADILATTGDAQ